MTANDLYHSLQLEALTLQGVRAEVTDDGRLREMECNAHVELQLTPLTVDQRANYQFALKIKLSCTGTPAKIQSNARVFDLELRALALYRQASMAPVSVEQFSADHTVFARQLFPALAMRAQALLDSLGMSNIRIPVDLPPQPVAVEAPANLRLN
jgi:hypothetical protein